ncbi:MAG: InlB B-repeat-containing protein [Clostridia bacterium]|nr:InlB B-repeat-containing protein [Clostridia bacterium]
MRKKQKNFNKRTAIVIIALFVFIFSLTKVCISLASSEIFAITGVEIIDQTSDVEVNEFDFDNSKVKSKVTFHNVGDSITFSVKIKNSSNENYIIKSVSDDNEIEYISLLYNDYSGAQFKSGQKIDFNITVKYSKENTDIEKRKQEFAYNIIFVLTDEEGNEKNEIIPVNPPESNNEISPTDTHESSEDGNISQDPFSSKSFGPRTGDNVALYIIVANASLIMIIVTIKKKDTKTKVRSNRGKSGRGKTGLFSILLVGLILLPTISKATTAGSFMISIDNEIYLKDKLVVTYDIDGVEDSIIVEYDENVEGLPTPEKEGYDFDGWIKEDETVFDINEIIKEDVKIIARFKAKEYLINYDLNGGSVDGVNPTKYTVESENITLINPTRENHQFIGWTGTGLNEATNSVTIPSGSTGIRSYVANWEKIQYNITFNPDGGTVDETTRAVDKGDSLGELPNPEKEGDYVFAGWYTNKNYTTKVTASTKPEGDATYYARWVDRMSTVYSQEGTVTFFGNVDKGYTVDGVENTEKNRYINTGVQLFTDRNFSRDFEIGFEIVNIINNNADNQQTIVNGKYENESYNYPGFAFRRYRSESAFYEFTSRAKNEKKDGNSGLKWEYGSISKVVISRIGGIIYLSIDGQEKIEIQDYRVIPIRYSTPITFGASHTADGDPMRYFNGTIKDMYIKLENKAEDY